MSIRNTIKKVWFSLYASNRVVLLDYPVKPVRLYSEEEKHPHQKLFQIISKYKLNYEKILLNTIQFKDKFATISEDKTVNENDEPGWNNGYFPGLDMIMLYSLLAQYRPTKYVEIGSGTSTKMAFKSRRENLQTYSIISIDPAPRKEIGKLADEVYKKEVQTIHIGLFQSLTENDVVFFDGTHTLYPNSDVMWFFLEVLPVLKKGVIVHIHDVYLPYDYPGFMLERYYSEQYLLGALLLNSPDKYEILSPNYFIYSEKGLHNLLEPVWELEALKKVEHHGGSFWFKIIS